MSTNLERYRKDIGKLIKEGNRLFSDISKNRDEATVFHSGYQRWYTEAQEVIKQILPNRHEEFSLLYNGEAKKKSFDASTYAIKDWLLGIRSSINKYSGEKQFEDFGAMLMRFQNQVLILESCEASFESSLFNIKQLVQADLFDSELDVAKELNKKGFVRGAGAIAGVVLEKHLAQVCADHTITMRKRYPAINDYNNTLKDDSVIEIKDFRFIQHLADIRNLCDHDKEKEPKKEDVRDMIDGVEKIVKTIL